MANQYNSNTHTKIQTVFSAIRTALTVSGTALDTDYSFSPGFTLTLAVAPDGQSIAVTLHPSDQGQSNAFGPADASGHLTRVPAKVIQASALP